MCGHVVSWMVFCFVYSYAVFTVRLKTCGRGEDYAICHHQTVSHWPVFDSVEEQVTIKVYLNHNFSVKKLKYRSGIEPPNYGPSQPCAQPYR